MATSSDSIQDSKLFDVKPVAGIPVTGGFYRSDDDRGWELNVTANVDLTNAARSGDGTLHKRVQNKGARVVVEIARELGKKGYTPSDPTQKGPEFSNIKEHLKVPNTFLVIPGGKSQKDVTEDMEAAAQQAAINIRTNAQPTARQAIEEALKLHEGYVIGPENDTLVNVIMDAVKARKVTQL